MRALPHWLVFTIPAATFLGGVLGGAWTVATMALVFVIVPALEPLFGSSRENPDGQHERRYDVALLVYVLVHLALQVWGLWWVASGHLGVGAAVVFAAALGITAGGGGITVAHELMHRNERSARAGAELLMASVTYTHFCIEHVHGHHRHVATPRDAASSRLGESLYAFLPRTIGGSLRSAIAIERELAGRKGISPWSLRHRLTRYALTQAIVYGTIVAFAGWVGVAFWAGQSLVAVILLEGVNYVEHYGLARREIAAGKYERVQPWHSWNASHRLTNWLLFNLQRHSDHHFLASREYDRLRHYDDVPQLPAGYPAMVLCSLVPPLYRRVMDPRVRAIAERAAQPRAQPAGTSGAEATAAAPA